MAFSCSKFLTVVAVLMSASIVHAARPTAEKVELFSAIKARQIGVKLIPKDATQATVIIKNRTDRPLSIQMPRTFAGIPVLAQNNNAGGNNSGSSSSNQTMGGGMMGGGMMGGGMMGGGMFNVGPERVGKIKVATVCLEHGKKDPNPRVPYKIRPITEFTRNTELIEVVKMLGDGKLNQMAAQAAAWHLSDGLTWQQLASQVKIKHLNGSVEMYFNRRQLQTALTAVSVARLRASRDRKAPTVSPGEIADANQ